MELVVKEYLKQPEIIDFYKKMVAFSFEDNKIDDKKAKVEELNDKVAKLQSFRNGEGKLLLFYNKNKLVATISYSKPNDLLRITSKQPKLCDYELGTVFIDPSMQGRGFLSQMIMRIKEELIKQNIEEVCFDCGYQNAQQVWIHKYGQADEVFNDFWGEGSIYMIWYIEVEKL